MIITIRIDPQYRVWEQLNNFIQEVGLELRGIDTSRLVIEGHPLYQVGTKQGEKDTKFPLIGVEWDHDEQSDDLSMNSGLLAVNDHIRGKILNSLKRGSYEQLSIESFNDFLASNLKFVDTFKRHVHSKVNITGWAIGNDGQKTQMFLYQAVDTVFPWIVRELKKQHGVELAIDGTPTLNILNEQFGDRAFGFEMTWKLSQVTESFRLLDNFQNIIRADVYLEKSNSVFMPFQAT